MGDVAQLNAWLDRLPRTTFDVGTQRVPAFRSLGIVGFHLALVTAVLAGLVNGTPLVTTLGLSATAALSFFAWALARRGLTGGETLVLIEYVWVAIASVAGFLWLSGAPVARSLDVFAVAICPFLACGRLGCLTVGCCHGIPGAVGVRYGPGHHLPPRLEGRRLVPVQLFEAAALVLIGVVGLALLGRQAGTATVWFLAAYAVVRFGLHRLRGDRGQVLAGLPVAQSMCVVQLGLAVTAAEAWLVPGPPGRAAWVGAGALGVALGAALARGRSDRGLMSSGHLDETWRVVAELAERAGREPGPVTGETDRGLVVAASKLGGGRLHVSLSHRRQHNAFGVGLALAPDATEINGITHLTVPLGPVAEAAEPVEPARPVATAAPLGPPPSGYFDRPGTRGVA